MKYLSEDPFKFKGDKKGKKKGGMGKGWCISSAPACFLLSSNEASVTLTIPVPDLIHFQASCRQLRGYEANPLFEDWGMDGVFPLRIHSSSKQTRTARKARRRVNWASGGAYQVHPACFLVFPNGASVTLTSVR